MDGQTVIQSSVPKLIKTEATYLIAEKVSTTKGPGLIGIDSSHTAPNGEDVNNCEEIAVSC